MQTHRTHRKPREHVAQRNPLEQIDTLLDLNENKTPIVDVDDVVLEADMTPARGALPTESVANTSADIQPLLQSPGDVSAPQDTPGEPVPPKKTYVGPGDLFNDFDTTPMGLVKSHFWGLEQARWWETYHVVGKTRNNYNLLHSPLGLIGNVSPFRIRLIHMVDSVWFESITLTCILLNSVFLCLDSPENADNEEVQSLLAVSEIFFQVVFSLEACAKILSLGLVRHSKSYLHDSWNVLDIIIVLFGFMNFIPGVANLTGIRVLRLLRPLRTVSRVPGLRVLIVSLIKALPNLRDTFTLLFAIVALFAIMGMELWSGTYRQRCYGGYSFNHSDTSLVYYPIVNSSNLCSFDPNGARCDMTTNGVTLPQKCVAGVDNVNTLYHYDNLLAAMLQVYIVVTFESWPDVMVRSLQADSFYAITYYLALYLIGGLVCMDIFLAVLKEAYSAEWQARRMLSRLNKLVFSRHVYIHEIVPITPSSISFNLIRNALAVYQSVGITPDSESDSTKITRGDLESATSSEQGDREAQAALEYGDGNPLPPLDASDGDEHEMTEKSAGKAKSEPDTMPTANDGVDGDEPPQGNPLEGTGDSQAVNDQEGTKWQVISSRFHRVVLSSGFGHVFLFIAIYNVAVISIDHQGIDRDISNFIDISNFVCNLLFIVEMVLKVVALRPLGYVRDPFNILDGILVLISIPDMAVTGSSSFSVLRAFRVARVVVLARRIQSVHNIVMSIAISCKNAFYLSLFLLLFVYMMGVLGMQLFSNVKPSADQRVSFTSFGDSMLSAFIVVSGENWPRLMKYYIDNTGSNASGLYFLFVALVGETLLLNTFIAILIDAFHLVHEQGKLTRSLHTLTKKVYTWATRLRPPSLSAPEVRSPTFRGDEPSFSTSQNRKNTIYSFSPSYFNIVSLREVENAASFIEQLANNTECQTRAWAHNGLIYPKCFQMNHLLTWLVLHKYAITREHALHIVKKINQDGKVLLCVKGGREVEDDHTTWTVKKIHDPSYAPFSCLYGTSMNIFGPKNRLRVTLSRVIHHPLFTWPMVILIVLSCVFLAMDDSRSRSSTLTGLIDSSSYLFGIVFMLEMIAKMIVYGVVLFERDVPTTHHSCENLHEAFSPYFHVAINRVDAFVAITSFMALFYQPFRVFRCLRSLRLGARSGRIRTVLSALFNSVPAVINVAIMLIFITLIFGVLATQLLAGKMYYCTDSSINTLEGCIGNFSVITNASVLPFDDAILSNATLFVKHTNTTSPREWKRSYINFDDTAQSMFALFVVLLGDGWYDVMYDAMDATSVGVAPRFRASPQYAILFLFYYVVAGLYVGNLFITVLIQKFEKTRKSSDGSAMLTNEQQEWIRGIRMSSNILLVPRPQRPPRAFRAFCYDVCTLTPHDVWLKVSGIRRKERRESLSDVLRNWQNVRPQLETPRSVLDMTVEIIVFLNVAIMSAQFYNEPSDWATFTDVFSWCAYTTYVLEAGLKITAYGPRMYWRQPWNRFDFFILVCATIGNIFGNGAIQVLRAMRVVRLLRLGRSFKGLMKMCKTLFFAIPSFINVVCLILLIFYNFGVMAMDVCGGVERNSDMKFLNDFFHFDDFVHSALTLFVIGTKENWGNCLEDCASQRNSGQANTFFAIFMIFGGLVSVNLFSAVVVDIFTAPPPSKATASFYRQLKMFRLLWLEHDPTAVGRITANQFLMTLRQLQPPLGFTTHTFLGELRYITSLMVQVDANSYVEYNSVVHALAQKHLCVNSDEVALIQRFVKCPQLHSNSWKLYHWYVAKHVQRRWQVYCVRKKRGGNLESSEELVLRCLPTG